MANVILKKLQNFFNWPLGLKFLFILSWIAIFGLLFTDELPLDYIVSGMYFCYSVLFLCQAYIFLTPKYVNYYKSPFLKINHNKIVGIILLLIGLGLLIAALVSFVIA